MFLLNPDDLSINVPLDLVQIVQRGSTVLSAQTVSGLEDITDGEIHLTAKSQLLALPRSRTASADSLSVSGFVASSIA